MRIAKVTLLLVLCLATLTAAQESTTARPEATGNSVTLGIVLDCSGSQRLQLDHMLSAVKQISETLTENDRAFLVRFVDAAKISVVQELTSNRDEIVDAADSVYIEGGQTAVIDAVYVSAKYLAKNDNSAGSTRVFLLISDGDDRGSGKKLDDTVAFLKENQIKVFAIGISDLKVSSKVLDRFSKETGGKTFLPRTTVDLSNAIVSIAKLMRGAATK